MIGIRILFFIRNSSPYYALVLPLAAIGFGVAFTMPAATMLAIHAVPEHRAGIASAAFTTSRQVGSLLGVALFVTIINLSKHFMQGMQVTLMIASTIFIVGVLFACWLKG